MISKMWTVVPPAIFSVRWVCTESFKVLWRDLLELLFPRDVTWTLGLSSIEPGLHIFSFDVWTGTLDILAQNQGGWDPFDAQSSFKEFPESDSRFVQGVWVKLFHSSLRLTTENALCTYMAQRCLTSESSLLFLSPVLSSWATSLSPSPPGFSCLPDFPLPSSYPSPPTTPPL